MQFCTCNLIYICKKLKQENNQNWQAKLHKACINKHADPTKTNEQLSTANMQQSE